jgi:hypothetical protein
MKFAEKIRIICQFLRISYANDTVCRSQINLNKGIYINNDRLMIASHIKNKNWELRIENLIKINLKLRRERQITEYQAVKHAASRRNITINKL